MEVNKDFKEFIELLNKNEVHFVIVGGYAVSFHGYPRYTQDIDFLFEPTQENAGRLLKTLKDFGFENINLENAEVCKQGQIIQLGQPPNRIDVINKIDGVTFERVWQNKVASTYGDQPCYYIGRQELLMNKRTINRPKDQGDLDFLSKSKTTK